MQTYFILRSTWHFQLNNFYNGMNNKMKFDDLKMKIDLAFCSSPYIKVKERK